MRIGIDARSLTEHKSGIGQYLINILQCWQNGSDCHEYILYSNTKIAAEFQDPRFHLRQGQSRRSSLWCQFQLPFALRRDRIDVFWGSAYALPVWRFSIPAVMTVHDFVFRRYPDMLPFRVTAHLRAGMPFFLRSAEMVIADSYSTAKDLNEYYESLAGQVEVIHLAAHTRFHEKATTSSVEDVLGKYFLQKGYLLYVGTIEPRKGLDTILRAIDYCREAGKELSLVVIGQVGWKSDDILQLIDSLALQSRVRRLDFVEDADLPALYRGASLFLYPSVYEGFGIPVLEAMASGTPVISSNAASLPEVAGDAALYVEPDQPMQLARQILRCIDNTELLNTMQQKGRQQAEKFSWNETARRTLKVLEQVAGKTRNQGAMRN